MVTPFVQLETTKTVVKSVVDETIDGYEAAYSCYFSDGGAQLPFTASTKSVKEDDDHCE